MLSASSSVSRPSLFATWVLPALLLLCAYGLLALTFTEQLTHSEIMSRCVLMDPNRARIWSVGNVEIGLAYFGVFFGMVFYFLRIYRRSNKHLLDLGLALAYLFCSFALDYFCVQHFEPFIALLIGDAVVMTFTVMVSRQLWFQRLLGVFVPIIFFTCGVGHLLEGLSYWHLTYPVNTPWTMVTADVGFAVLVNANRFPAFIRGEDVVAELAEQKTLTEQLRTQIEERQAVEAENLRLLDEARASAAKQLAFMRDALASVTGGRLFLCGGEDDLPKRLPQTEVTIDLTATKKLQLLRQVTREVAIRQCFPDQRWQYLETATGEAGMNAIVHAGGGAASVHTDGDGKIQVWIEDHGGGIPVGDIPRAALQRGYTTAGTLGHGMKLMIQTADRVWLLTSNTGTTVVIEQNAQAPELAWA